MVAKEPPWWHRLIFDGHGALDLFQLYFAVWLGLCCLAVVLVGFGVWTLPADGWYLLRYAFYSLMAPAMPTWLAKIWLSSKTAAPALPTVPGIIPGADTDTAHP